MTWAVRQFVLGLALTALLAAADRAAAQRIDDGLRKIDSPRFGVVVRAPVAWNLVQWSEDDKAFVLALPQEKGSPAGHVSCELTLPPETLTDFQKRNQAEHDREQQSEQKVPPIRRTLLTNDLEKITARTANNDRPAADDPPEANGAKQDAGRNEQCLVTVWELDCAAGAEAI